MKVEILSLQSSVKNSHEFKSKIFMDFSPTAKCFVPEKYGQECSMGTFATYNKELLELCKREREREREHEQSVYTGPGAGTAQQV